MVTGGRAPTKLVIVNSGAGAVSNEGKDRLRQAFSDAQIVEFPPDPEVMERLADEGATVIACGGDGTISAVAKMLAGTNHVLGILPLGTFNNFASALGIPAGLDAAIDVLKTGRPAPCTLGCVNGFMFLEAAAVGFFGDMIALGEAAKDLHFGDLAERLMAVVEERRFRFKIDGDVRLRGEAVSILVSNTPSIGARLPVGGASPENPYLEMVINRGGRLSIIGRLLAALMRRRPARGSEHYRIRRLRIETDPPLTVHADVTEAGRTPADVAALAGGLRVILPA